MTTSNTPIYASQARPWLKFYDQKYIDQTMPACTAFELVCRQNKNRLGETALEYYGRKFTYADFIVNVKKTAAALRAAGLKKGDIATVVSVMTPEIIFAFYAADMIGATLNLVDPRYSVEGIREYIEEVDSHLLICLNVVYERCHQAAKRTHVEHVVVLSPADSLPLPLALGYKVQNLDKNKYHSNVIHWKQFLAAGKDESIAAEPYDPEHACVVVHTGGTTGSPKGVMLTDNNFNGIAMQFSACDTLFSKAEKEIRAMLVGFLGGRAAEEIVFDTVTTGASNDIEKATRIARAMVTQYGMSKKFGLMGLESQENQYLNGRTVLNCSDMTAAEIDKEVMHILKVSYEEAKRLLSENREALDKIAAFLIEKETITGKEFMKIFHEVKGIPELEEKKQEGEDRIEMPEAAKTGDEVQPVKTAEETNAENSQNQQKLEGKPADEAPADETPESAEAVAAESPNEDEMRGGSSFDRK